MKSSDNPTRPIAWEDETPLEPRFRRVQQGVLPGGRALPGMPLEMADPGGDDAAGPSGGASLSERRNPWWRPASTVGRVFLGLATAIVLAGMGTGGYLLKTCMGHDARFRIGGTGNIEVAGLTQVSRAEMLPVFGEDIGRNIFFVDLAERRKQLEAIPWVERATVMRLLPDRIRVSIVERNPVAFARQGQQFGLVDANGVLLAMTPSLMAQKHYSFPTLSGIDPGDPQASRKMRMDVYLRLVGDLDSTGQKLSEQISEIDLTDPEDARVTMQDDSTLLHFGEDHFLDRYRRYKAHIAEWRQQYPKLAAVDLRYEQQVVLEMAKGTSAVEATMSAQAAADGSDGKPSAGQAAADGQPAGVPAEKQVAEAKDPTYSLRVAASAASLASQSEHSVKPKPGNTSVHAAESGSAKSNSNPAKGKTATATAPKDRKRPAAQRAALNGNKRKPSPQARPAVTGIEGE